PLLGVEGGDVIDGGLGQLGHGAILMLTRRMVPRPNRSASATRRTVALHDISLGVLLFSATQLLSGTNMFALPLFILAPIKVLRLGVVQATGDSTVRPVRRRALPDQRPCWSCSRYGRQHCRRR